MMVAMRYFARTAAIAAALAAYALASGTQAWEMSSYGDFVRGRFDGISLSREGRLSLAPKMETVFTSDQPVIWSVAEAPDGTLYAGTGHRGRVYRIDRTGKSSLLWTAEQPEIVVASLRAAIRQAETLSKAAWPAESARGVRYALTNDSCRVKALSSGPWSAA